MRSNYKRIGDFIRGVNIRNVDLKATTLLGINIDKFFMPSVANIVGTDMSNYKIVKKGQFACNRMHVGRDKRLPVALSNSSESFIVSPAYDVFEIIDTEVLLPEYLMMWFSRKEYDRNAWFYTDADVRGGLNWKAFCDMKLPIPKPEKQKEIVKEYNVLVNRIVLNTQLIQQLEETAQAIYKQWFVDFEFPDENGKPYKSNGGEMVERELGEIPKGWKLKTLDNVCKVVTKGTTPNKMYREYSSDRIVYIKAECILENHGFDESKLSYIDANTHNTLARSIIYENDILYTIAGTLGKFAKVTNRVLPSNINQAVAIIRVDKDKIATNYIYGLLLGNWHTLYYAKNVQQAVQANLSLTTIKSLPILIPSDGVLKNIVNIINPLIELLQNLLIQTQALISLKETFLQKLSSVKE